MRRTGPLSLTILIASFAAPSSALAYGDRVAERQADPGDAEAIVAHLFEVSDLDEDGALSSDEYARAGLDQFGLSFEACDRDADGALTSQEFLELYRQHHPTEPALDV